MSTNTLQEEADSRYYPMLAFEGSSIKEDLHAAWVAYRALPEEAREILLATAMPMKLRLLCEKFQIEDTNIVKVSSAIREMFFKKSSLDETALIISEFSSADQAMIADFIQKEILSVKPDSEVSEEVDKTTGIIKPTKETLPLLQALGKYAQIGGQVITREKIRIKGHPEPVRGSLVNWLKVYRDELGVGYHDPVLRAKFLFNSPNAKSVTSEERERLNLILRSIEENVPVTIDLGRMEIIFPSFNVTELPKPMPRPPIAAAAPSPQPSHPSISSAQKKTETVSKPASVPAPVVAAPPAPPIPPAPVKSSPPPTLPVREIQKNHQPEPLVPKPAPKRSNENVVPSFVPTLPKKSVFVIEPVKRNENDSTEQTENSNSSGLRVGRGGGFHSLERTDIPKEKPQEEQQSKPAPVSFSSKHAFPVEQGTLSIRRDAKSVNKPVKPGSPSGARLAPIASLPDTNPFHIRPMNMIEREKTKRDIQAGRIVDLRTED